MGSNSFPTPFHYSSDRSLTGPVPTHFEAFYRLQLRFRTGCRLRSLDVTQRYTAWAAEAGAPGMSMKEVCRAMRHIGHRRFRSNQTYFGDVQLASESPDLRDNFPRGALAPSSDSTLLSAIDRIEAELGRLRQAVGARGAGQKSSTPAPNTARK